MPCCCIDSASAAESKGHHGPAAAVESGVSDHSHHQDHGGDRGLAGDQEDCPSMSDCEALITVDSVNQIAAKMAVPTVKSTVLVVRDHQTPKLISAKGLHFPERGPPLAAIQTPVSLKTLLRL